MDQWAAHFQEMSERRRRRNRRANLIRATWIALALIALIGAAFWATTSIMEQLTTL